MTRSSFEEVRQAVSKGSELVRKSPWKDEAWEFDWVQCVLNHGWTVDDFRKCLHQELDKIIEDASLMSLTDE